MRSPSAKGIVAAALSLGAAAFQSSAAPADGREWAERRAAELVARMTLEEKVSQTLDVAAAIPRLGVPRYVWWNEALHGVARAGLATVFPQTIGRAATFDRTLERAVGEVVGTEARAKYNLFAKRGVCQRYSGLTLWSPTVNLFRDPRWGRGQETFGEDPYLTGKMGSAYVRGIQGDDPRFLRCGTCAKHFAVHSGPERLRYGFDVRVPERDLREYYLPAFQTLVQEGGCESVMAAYNSVNGTPVTANGTLLTDILRGEWGFRGHVVSDCFGVHHLAYTYRLGGGPVGAAALASAAGLDLGTDRVNTNLLAAVRTGALPEATLDRQLVRLFATRYRLGLFEKPGTVPYDALGEADVATPAHRELALRSAEESLVLVANRGNALPLDRTKVRRLAVTGPRAKDEVALYGNYYGAAGACVTPYTGLAVEAGAGVIVSDLEFEDAPETPLDAIVACIGLTADMEGEDASAAANQEGDRRTLALPKSDIDLLKSLRKGFPKGPIVAVVFGGSPVDLAPVTELCDAVLLAWYPGEQGGRAIARAIFGEANPAGRLPVTFPARTEDLPPMESYALPGRTYRYATARPQHPFGYGLSYTRFAYSNPVLKRNGGGRVSVSADVRNVGLRAGDEVVQLYVRAPEGSGDRRLHHLEGFERIRLASGESRTVSFDLDARQLSVFDADGRAFLPKGETTFFIGGGQPGFAETVSVSADGLL